MRRIGFLSGFAESDSNIQRWVKEFVHGLEGLGWVDGRNIRIDARFADADAMRLSMLANELVELGPEVIVASGGPAASALRQQTLSIQIVFVQVVDPVAAGFVTNLARPEGTPSATRVAALINPAETANTELRDAQAGAQKLGLQINVHNADNIREIEVAFQSMARERADALYVQATPLFVARQVQLVHLATLHRLPAAYGLREFVEAGGLLSYGASAADAYRQIGVYAGRILKGAKPADLPVVQASKFELVINASSARMLDLSVPPTLLRLADEVIE